MIYTHSFFFVNSDSNLNHILFLQTLIDRGMTSLPVFGSYEENEPTAILTAYGYCMVDTEDERAKIQGMSTACLGTIAFTKIIVVGLSLGTGVCGGHFWAPLFVGCAASHFFTDIMGYVTDYIGFGSAIASYPCLSVICIMGCTHVVTFRAQMAIILVLTLSIKSFTTAEKLFSVNGDYAAIFPLLVIASYIPLSFTRSITFYAKQCSRGDISVIPEALCEPNKSGTTHVYRIDNMDDVSNSESSFNDDDDDLSTDDGFDDDKSDGISLEAENYDKSVRSSVAEDTTVNAPQADMSSKDTMASSTKVIDPLDSSRHSIRAGKINDPLDSSRHSIRGGKMNDPLDSSRHSIRGGKMNDPLGSSTHSNRSRRSRTSSTGSLPKPSAVQRVSSYGKIDDSTYQKPLLSQGRERASTTVASKSLRSVNDGPKLPRSHRRTISAASMGNVSPGRVLGEGETGDLDVSKH
jgi:hypothetical protein